jgi:hypothetical protein
VRTEICEHTRVLSIRRGHQEASAIGRCHNLGDDAEAGRVMALLTGAQQRDEHGVHVSVYHVVRPPHAVADRDEREEAQAHLIVACGEKWSTRSVDRKISAYTIPSVARSRLVRIS